MDFVSFVLQIPNTVDGFVKTARVIVAYKEIETSYTDVLKYTIHYAEKLRYLSRFIDGTSLGKQLDGSNEQRTAEPQESSDIPSELQHPDTDVLTKESQRILFDLFRNASSSLWPDRFVSLSQQTSFASIPPRLHAHTNDSWAS